MKFEDGVLMMSQKNLKRKNNEDQIVYSARLFLQQKEEEKTMENLTSGIQDIIAPKAGKQLTMEDIKEIIDIDKDKKITWKDAKLWLKIIGNALLIGFLLSLYYNFDSIAALLKGEEAINWVVIVQQLVVSAIVFTYKAAKQSATTQLKTQDAKITLLEKAIKLRDDIIANNAKINEDIITAYENQLFLFETDLAGKTKASKTKDEIARMLMEKYDELEAIYKKSHPLPLMEDLIQKN